MWLGVVRETCIRPPGLVPCKRGPRASASLSVYIHIYFHRDVAVHVSVQIGFQDMHPTVTVEQRGCRQTLRFHLFLTAPNYQERVTNENQYLNKLSHHVNIGSVLLHCCELFFKRRSHLKHVSCCIVPRSSASRPRSSASRLDRQLNVVEAKSHDHHNHHQQRRFGSSAVDPRQNRSVDSRM